MIRSLHVICRPLGDNEDLTAALLSPPGEGSLVKALYFLLIKHRERSLEDYGMGDTNDSNIRHYPAPPPQTRPKSKTVSHGTGAVATRDVTSSQQASHGHSASPQQLASNAEPSSPDKHDIRPRPASPLGPRPPYTSASHAETSPTYKKHQSRPISTPLHGVTDVMLKHPTPKGATPVTAPTGPPRPAHPRRGRTIDGLPFSTRPDGVEDIGASLRHAVPAVTFVRAPGAGSPKRVQGNGGFGAAMVPWPQIQPPIVDDPELQRTIDEVAGRFNALALNDYRVSAGPPAQNGDRVRLGGNVHDERLMPARGTNVNTVGDQDAHLTDAQAYAQAHGEERRRGRNALYYHANNATVSLVDKGSDKENAPRRHTVTTRGSLEQKAGFVQKESSFAVPRNRTKDEKKVNRRSRRKWAHCIPESFNSESIDSAAPLDLHNAKRSTLIGMGFGSPLMSPPLTGASAILASPAVGEFKGWFSNLFNWKAQQYVLYSVDNCLTTRDEVMRLLGLFGVNVLLEDAQGWGILRCRAEEGYGGCRNNFKNKANLN